MSNPEPIMGTFYDLLTGESVTRELTPEEIAALPQPAPPAEQPPMEGNPMKIAVYTIAKNEEAFVQRWYDSAKEADHLRFL